MSIPYNSINILPRNSLNVITRINLFFRFAHGLRQEVVDALTAPLETKITIVYRFQNVHLEFVLQNE